jgi:amidohydrolase
MENSNIYDLNKLIELRKHLHQHPELSYAEHETSKHLLKFLGSLGVDTKNAKKTAITGYVVDIPGKAPKSGKPKIVALRAEMDALEMTEDNPHLSYKTVNAKAAHMCGHDGHMTCLMGGVAKIMEKIDQIPEDKVVRLLLQPAEERWGGANVMVQEGCLVGVSEVYGYHNFPNFPTGTLAVKAGPMMSQVTVLEIVFIGKGGHGSAPQKANDPMQPAVDFHVKFREMVNEFKAQGKEKLFVSTFPLFQCGEAPNVIAEKCYLKGTLRSFDADFTLEFKTKLQQIVDESAKKYNCKVETVFQTNYPVTFNHDTETENVRRVGEKVYGKENVISEGLPVYASEDFSFFLEAVPGCFFFLGSHKKDGDMLMLHNSHFDFNDELIPKASEFYMKLVEDRFELNFK